MGVAIQQALAFGAQGAGGLPAGRGRPVAGMLPERPWSLPRRVPEDCPQGVADLWQACIVADPSARPSAADAQAALNSLQCVPRPAPPPAERAAPDPPIAASAGVGAPQAAKQGAGAPCSGVEPAGKAPNAVAGNLGAATAEEPARGQHVEKCSHEGQAAAGGAEGDNVKANLGEPGAAGRVTQVHEPEQSGTGRACADSPAFPLDVPVLEQ